MRLIGLAILTLSLVVAPFAVEGQPTGKVYRIGVLETVSSTLNTANLDAFRQGLRELGYVEGQNFVIGYRSADGRPERFPWLGDRTGSLEGGPDRDEGDTRGAGGQESHRVDSNRHGVER